MSMREAAYGMLVTAVLIVTAVVSGTAGGFAAWLIFQAVKDMGWI